MLRQLPLRYIEKLVFRAEERREKAHADAEAYKAQCGTEGKEPDPAKLKKLLFVPEIWLACDCEGYRHGYRLDTAALQRIRTAGYETLWISDREITRYEESEGKYSELMHIREKIWAEVASLYLDIKEAEAGTQRAGSRLNLLEGQDLLGLKLTPLQKEGAARLAAGIFGQHGEKISPLKHYVEQIYTNAPKQISLFDNRSLWNENGRAGDYLVKHATAVGILFTLTVRHIQTERMARGTQSSSVRYTQGMSFNRDENVAYSRDVVDMACAGAFLFDIGFNHVFLKKLLSKGTASFGPDNTTGFSQVSRDEYKTLKKHVNAGAHLIQNLGTEKTAIIANLMRMHHAYLNGEGYPPRKGQEHQMAVGEKSGKGKMIQVVQYSTAVHELANLLSIIDVYDAMLYRRPWRLPFTRHETVEYLYNNAAYRYDYARDCEDTAGISAFSGNIRHPKRFDRHLVDSLFRVVRPYVLGEAVPLLKKENHQRIGEAAISAYTSLPHRPIIRIKAGEKVHEIDLSSEKANPYYLGEYIDTTNPHKIQRSFANTSES